MNKPPTLGDQELTLLRYITDHAPITVREVTEQFGAPHGLARTTILTMMERLRRKNFLTRSKDQGAFQYQPMVAKTELMQNLVKEFVDKSLGGSLSPFVAYLSQAKNLSEHELSDLRQLLKSSEAEGKQA
ncbi:MAG: BlaI/MecI/CopY family transcriptional regulator [Janthinobacterium lividum]